MALSNFERKLSLFHFHTFYFTILPPGIAARETANHLGDLIGAVRGICACTDDRNDQNVVIDNAKDVLDEAQRMMEYSKVLLNNPDSGDAVKNLHEANKAVSNAIHNLLNSLPGQKDVDSAIKEIARASVAITDSQFPPTKVSISSSS